MANGQRLITEKLDHLRSICLGFWIPAGSRDEPRGLAGATHFIEHLLFKGSSKYTAEEIAQIFDTLGGELNASTSREYVVVYGRFLDDQLPVAMDVMADMLLTPDVHRSGPGARGHPGRDRHGGGLAPGPRSTTFWQRPCLDGHPLAHPILGTRRASRRRPEDDMRAYHRRTFRFSDMVVAAAGNVDHDELRALLLERQSARRRSPGERDAFRHRLSPRRQFVSKETEQMHVCFGGVGLARNDERRFELSVLDSLFGGSLSSRLFQEVREKRGLVYSMYSFSNLYRETGLVGLYFGCRPERLGTVVETVGRELVRLVKEPVPEDELQQGQGAPERAHDPGPGEHFKPHDPPGQGGDHRHGDPVPRPTGAAHRRRHQRATARAGRRVVSAGALSVVGIGADEEAFTKAVPADCLAGLID